MPVVIFYKYFRMLSVYDCLFTNDCAGTCINANACVCVNPVRWQVCMRLEFTQEHMATAVFRPTQLAPDFFLVALCLALVRSLSLSFSLALFLSLFHKHIQRDSHWAKAVTYTLTALHTLPLTAGAPASVKGMLLFVCIRH